jgi:hypothetical protein
MPIEPGLNAGKVKVMTAHGHCVALAFQANHTAILFLIVPVAFDHLLDLLGIKPVSRDRAGVDSGAIEWIASVAYECPSLAYPDDCYNSTCDACCQENSS